MTENNPFDRVVEPWEAVMEDMSATAAGYREAGFSVLELHPGDVAVENDERYGLDVLVPGEEYDELERVAAATEFESYEVYHATEAGMTFLLLVLTDPATEQAVCCPAYYDDQAVEALARRSHAEGVMYTHVRPLDDETRVTFTHEEPDLFFPDAASE